MKLLRKPELSINICCETLYVINVAFGYEKNNPARRAGEKNNLAPILSEKNFSARTKIPSPPPPPPPEYQIDRALHEKLGKDRTGRLSEEGKGASCKWRDAQCATDNLSVIHWGLRNAICKGTTI